MRQVSGSSLPRRATSTAPVDPRIAPRPKGPPKHDEQSGPTTIAPAPSQQPSSTFSLQQARASEGGNVPSPDLAPQDDASPASSPRPKKATLEASPGSGGDAQSRVGSVSSLAHASQSDDLASEAFLGPSLHGYSRSQPSFLAPRRLQSGPLTPTSGSPSPKVHAKSSLGHLQPPTLGDPPSSALPSTGERSRGANRSRGGSDGLTRTVHRYGMPPLLRSGAASAAKRDSEDQRQVDTSHLWASVGSVCPWTPVPTQGRFTVRFVCQAEDVERTQGYVEHLHLHIFPMLRSRTPVLVSSLPLPTCHRISYLFFTSCSSSAGLCRRTTPSVGRTEHDSLSIVKASRLIISETAFALGWLWTSPARSGRAVSLSRVVPRVHAVLMVSLRFPGR